MEASHTSDDISRVVMACLLDWNVDKKVNTITVDNASNNDAMLTKIRAMLNRDQLFVLGGKFLHVRCTTHILNLIVKDGLSVIGSALSKIRESCKFVKGTPQRKLKWKSAVDQVKVATTKQICLDVPTSLLLAVAVVLDPRFKMMFVQFYYNLINGADDEVYASQIRDTLFDLYNEYASESSSNSSTSTQVFHDSSSSEAMTGISKDKLQRFETWCHNKEGYDGAPQKFELEQYLDEPIFLANSSSTVQITHMDVDNETVASMN
ncbi:hypothetical protein IFM89_015872 [Coptis chinensis]|uniref:hAT-like transposase RNase-H fold domain-containing protein n=1 Tax=Coptis chinensis TaxID=261450 RepID=A0A835IL99_9MAGN|nr:hypothetical protein IFM89_015872 [Coptis chinensis]